MPKQPVYDVIVVGSGAAGGIAAYVLTMEGLNVLCLEAGRMLEPAKDFYTHKFPYEWPFRGEGKPGAYGKPPQGMEWKIKEWTDHLYTIPEEDPYALTPGSKFTWTRLRAVGGRTNLWGRETERFGPLDFKPKTLQDGSGEDWPISYEEVEDYYDRVERLIGVSGSSEGVFNSPMGKHLLRPFNARCGEWLTKKGAQKLGIKAIPKPLAVLSGPFDGRPPCHYCGACTWGCDVRARFSSLDVLIPKLVGMRNFTLRTNAVVHTVLLDRATGKAGGVTYIDAASGSENEAHCKAVVLGASMIESIRILLNSRTREFPQGLANSSGALGHYLMDHVAFNGVQGYFPQLAGRATTNDDGPGEGCLYIPRYNYGHKDKKRYLRGWQFNIYTGCGLGPGPGATLPGFGLAYKRKIKELYPAAVHISGYGEGLPFYSNYVEIDPALCDRQGIPQVRFHTHSEYPHAFAIRDEMYHQIEEILGAAGAVVVPYRRVAPYPLGAVTHEAGGCRMGSDPRTSVLDKWNRCHDVGNVLVVDASCFVTHPEKPITHTIMAISWRACEHLAEQFRAGNA
jgi:choline dehydrogenase-like flavoprotein